MKIFYILVIMLSALILNVSAEDYYFSEADLLEYNDYQTEHVDQLDLEEYQMQEEAHIDNEDSYWANDPYDEEPPFDY